MANDISLQTRRCVLKNSAVGFGWLALRGLLDKEAVADQLRLANRGPLAAKVSHFPARAKRIVFLFMKGGPSHLDTFDPKPLLTRDDGKAPPFELPRITFAKSGNLLKSPWKFRQYGESGLPVMICFQISPAMLMTFASYGRYTARTRRTAERYSSSTQGAISSSVLAWAPG